MPHVGQAFDWFEDNWDIFKPLEIKSMLYVGLTNSTKEWWKNEFCDALGIETVAIIDIFGPNCVCARRRYPDIEVIQGDVTKIGNHIKREQYDLIFWDHGPEHAEESVLTHALDQLKEYAGKCVITACPWGNFPQKAIYGNAHEEHKFDVFPSHFEPSGYTVVTINTVDVTAPCGELISYWIRE